MIRTIITAIYYATSIISIFGIIINLLSSVIFQKIILKYPNIHIYKFFMAKSVSDTIHFVFQFFAPIYFCDLLKGILPKLWYVWCHHFAQDACIFFSNYMSLSATVTSALTLRYQSFRLSNKKANALIIFIFVSSLTLSMFNLFRYEIIRKSRNSTFLFSDFEITRTVYYYSNLDRYIRFTQILIKTYLYFIVLFFVNICILIQIKSLMDRKQAYSSSISHQNKTFRLKTEIYKQKIQLVIILNGIVVLFGQIPLSIYYSPVDASAYFWESYYHFSIVPFYLSFLPSFFIYYKFNILFKNYFYKTLDIIKY